MQNKKFLLHPMTSPYLCEQTPPLTIKGGSDVHIWDDSGKIYLDMRGGLWNVNVGYNCVEIKDAIKKQLDELSYSPIFLDVTHPRADELAAKLVQMTACENMANVFFTSGGSDAIESALKLARQFWYISGQKTKQKFIALQNAYHGANFGGMSVGGLGKQFTSAYAPLLNECSHVDIPWLYRKRDAEIDALLAEEGMKNLEREIIRQDPATIAAIIAEPIQASGGVIVPPAEFWLMMRKLCDKYDLLLIADEVVTGFGRSGDMFGCRGWGVKPDILCLAKGINSGYVPLGATLINQRMADAWHGNAGPEAMLMHGYTYSGHPLACAAALAALDVVEREDLPLNARVVGDYCLEQLQGLMQEYPICVGVRGKGLMLAIDIARPGGNARPTPESIALARQAAQIAREEGVMVRPSANRLLLSPPLTITREHITQFMATMKIVFEKLAR